MRQPPPAPIVTEDQYRAALQRANQLMDAEPDTPEIGELLILALSIEQYERKHYPFPPKS